MQKTAISIQEQIQKALDGRTQRWLAYHTRIHETDISKKMKGVLDFSDAEIAKINEVLKSNIKK